MKKLIFKDNLPRPMAHSSSREQMALIEETVLLVVEGHGRCLECEERGTHTSNRDQMALIEETILLVVKGHGRCLECHKNGGLTPQTETRWP